MDTQGTTSRRAGSGDPLPPTGHAVLDELTGGLGPGQVWVVCGREDARRALSASVAWAAATSGAPVLWVSLLETPEGLAERSQQAGAGRDVADAHLELRTSGSLTPVHRPGGEPFRVVVLDDPYAEPQAVVTFLGLSLPRGGTLEMPLRLYAARARATVLVTGPTARLSRWGPDVQVSFPAPRRVRAGRTPTSGRQEARVTLADGSRSLVPLTL